MVVNLKSIPFKNENIIFRKVEDEYILVPMLSSSDDVEHIFNLNPVGAAIWERIDGSKNLETIITELSAEYDAQEDTIRKDVLEFMEDLLNAGIIELRDERD